MNTNNSIPVENIEAHFTELIKIGNLGPKLEDGFLRASWSKEETAAIEYIQGYGEKHGLVGRYDELGNLFLSTPNQGSKVIQIGSHLDTVPRGGVFDGGAGIVTGLEAILSVFSESKGLGDTRLELVIWRGEESGTFGAVFKGSKAAFGALDTDILNAKFNDQTLAQAITGQGYKPELIEKGTATISQEEIDSIVAHFELHIEQATKLESDDCDIGVVTSIRGPRRFRIVVHGEAAHSGGAPMGPEYRKDANLTVAHMQVALDQLGKKKLAAGNDLVQTVGIVNTDKSFNDSNTRMNEAAITKVSPQAYFSLDLRSNNNAFLDAYAEEVLELFRSIAADQGTQVEIQAGVSSQALESLDENLQNLVEEAAHDLGYSAQRLASGAGHDVGVVAAQKKSDGSTIPGALVFIPCRDGVSHNPLEFTTNEAMKKGADVLAGAIRKLLK